MAEPAAAGQQAPVAAPTDGTAAPDPPAAPSWRARKLGRRRRRRVEAAAAPRVSDRPWALTWLRTDLPLERAARAAGWVLVAGLAWLAYTWRVSANPPGFYLDEASIAYNAWSIAQSGTDEHGVAWPVFFQTWYPSVAVNPVFVYLLASVFKVAGPSVEAARLVSASVGFLAAVVLGLAVHRATRNPPAAIITTALALATPWLFEPSRLVFEVSLFPLVLAGLVLALRTGEGTREWGPGRMVVIAVLLGLLTYTYTIGRLLGPMLAAGLILMLPAVRPRNVVATWALYALTLLPAVAFNAAHPGVLTARADLLGYIKPGVPVPDLAARFANQVLVNFDLRRLLLSGDPNIRHHVPEIGTFLVAGLGLAVVGLDRIAHGGWRDGWQRYLVYGLLVAVIPASLTLDEFHTLRLIGIPVFLLVLAGLGAAALAARPGWGRTALAALVGLAMVQAAWFAVQFHRYGPGRGAAFDAAFPPVFEAAVATGASPIYLSDRGDLPGYIEAYWYGALRGMDRSSFVRLREGELPPSGAIVLGTNKVCGACEVLRQGGDYIAYRAVGATGSNLVPNGDFEETSGATFGVAGTRIFGWQSFGGVTLAGGGARTQTAHLVLQHGADGATTEQASSTLTPVVGGSVVRLSAAVRGTAAARNAPTFTIALVEVNAQREYVTWHPITTRLVSPDWQVLGEDRIQLAPGTAFVYVSCYLERGAPGDEVHVDDVIAAPVP